MEQIDFLGKAIDRYLDDFSKALPLHRLVILFLSFPPLLLVNAGEGGLVSRYLIQTPQQTFSDTPSSVWNAPIAVWILAISVSLASSAVVGTIRKLIARTLGRSSRNKVFTERIEAAGKNILAAIQSPVELQAALHKRYMARMSAIRTKLAASELFLSSSCLMVCYSSMWRGDEWKIALCLGVVGLLIEWLATFEYISNAAPSFLLHGILNGSLVRTEDGLFP